MRITPGDRGQRLVDARRPMALDVRRELEHIGAPVRVHELQGCVRALREAPALEPHVFLLAHIVVRPQRSGTTGDHPRPAPPSSRQSARPEGSRGGGGAGAAHAGTCALLWVPRPSSSALRTTLSPLPWK